MAFETKIVGVSGEQQEQRHRRTRFGGLFRRNKQQQTEEAKFADSMGPVQQKSNRKNKNNSRSRAVSREAPRPRAASPLRTWLNRVSSSKQQRQQSSTRGKSSCSTTYSPNDMIFVAPPLPMTRRASSSSSTDDSSSTSSSDDGVGLNNSNRGVAYKNRDSGENKEGLTEYQVRVPLGLAPGNTVMVRSLKTGICFPAKIPKSKKVGDVFSVYYDDYAPAPEAAQEHDPHYMFEQLVACGGSCMSADNDAVDPAKTTDTKYATAYPQGYHSDGVVTKKKKKKKDPLAKFGSALDNFLTPIPEVMGRPIVRD